MRERFLIGLLVGCLLGALVAPLAAQSWNRLYLTTSAGNAIPLAATAAGAAQIAF